MRPWEELEAAAIATGTYDAYVGDGASVPVPVTWFWSNAAGRSMQAYKEHLDENYRQAFRLHDWCYTPYGALIGVSKVEADNAMGSMIRFRRGPGPPPRNAATVDSEFDALACVSAVAAYGGPYFGVSQTGYDPAVFAAALPPLTVPDLNQAEDYLRWFQLVNHAIWEQQPMAVYKYTVGLQRIAGRPQAGFTETWYFDASSDEDARNRVTDYMSQRATILSKSWQVGTFARLAIMSSTCRRFKPQGRDKFCCVPRTEGRVQCVCPSPITGRLNVDADQNWDGLLIEVCTNSILHVGCAKCESQTKPFVRQWIMRGIPDSWYALGEPTIGAADKAKVNAFLQWLVNTMQAGSVGCSDACSDLDTTPCTSTVFARFHHACPRWDSPRKRNTGRPFGLPVGRRSRRTVAT